MTDQYLMCTVWRSSRKQGMYLYMPKGADFAELDETLQRLFGAPEHAMDLLLHPGRSLARADISDVLESLRSRGFYLQMPPSGDADIYALAPDADA